MGFLDRKLSDLSLGDLRHLIRTEVSLQTPPVPTGVKNLSDLDVPLVQPDTAQQGEALVFNASTGGWETGSLGIIDGSVTNAQIESVSGSKITAGILSAQLTLTGRLATALTGQRVEVDGGGVRAYDASSGLTVNIPADGSAPTFVGNVTTGGLVVTGNALIQGATNVMDKGSVLTLNEGQGNPNSAPSVTYAYNDSSTYSDLSVVETANGFAYSATGGTGGTTKVYVYVADGIQSTSATHKPKIVEIDAATGSVLRSRTVDTSHAKTQTIGVVYLGSTLYEVYKTTGGMKIDSYDRATWTYQATVNAPSLPASATPENAALTTDGTSLFIGFNIGSGINITSFSPAGVVNYSRAATGGATLGGGAIVAGMGWDGTNLRVVSGNCGASIGNTAVIESYLPAVAMTYVAGSGYAVALGIGARGGWDTTNSVWWLFDGNGTRYRINGVFWTAGNDTWYLGYVWDDGTHVTKVSPRSTVALGASYGGFDFITGRPYMGGRFAVTVPTFPAGITQVDLYALPSSSVPSATSLKLQTATAHVGSNAATTFTFFNYDSAGTAATNSNNFPTGTSSIKGSFAAGTAWVFGGDGTFQLPLLTTVNRLTAPSIGQAEYNSTLAGAELFDGTGYQLLQAEVDDSTLYDAINRTAGLTGSAAYPKAFTIPPAQATGEIALGTNTGRGFAFMVKNTISSVGASAIVSVAGVGALSSGYIGFTLLSLASNGDWTFLANTGATKANSFLTSTGRVLANWRDSGDTVDQAQTLVPGTVYYLAMSSGTFGTTQPKFLASATTAASGGSIQLNLGLTGAFRGASFAQTAKQTANVTLANQTNILVQINLFWLY